METEEKRGIWKETWTLLRLGLLSPGKLGIFPTVPIFVGVARILNQKLYVFEGLQ